jgi:signal transduction histidine kinase
VRRGRAPLTLDGARGPFRAALIVPLATRGQLCGTLTLVSCTRSYTADELALALDVAHRLAGAIAYAMRVTAAEAAVRARQEALAIVSHDLRNPLSTILTSTGRLLESAPDDRVVKPALERTQRAARRMMSLIGDLLDAASMEGGALLSLDRHEHDIGLVLTETVDLLQPLAEARAQTLTLDLRDLELGAECDRERVMQVLSNIVGNAIKFTPRGGAIRLGAERARGLVRVWVSDDGPGIAPDAIPHVFDRYWHTETRELRPGAGLGLYIAKGIVERHGGHIWVETTQGRGTTFHFTLPAAPLRDRAEIPPAT